MLKTKLNKIGYQVWVYACTLHIRCWSCTNKKGMQRNYQIRTSSVAQIAGNPQLIFDHKIIEISEPTEKGRDKAKAIPAGSCCPYAVKE